MKGKRTVLILIPLLILIVGYFGYKGVNLYFYNTKRIESENYSKFIEGLKIENTITINKKNIPEEEYLTFNNIKVKNNFKDFKKMEYPESTDEYVKYILRDINDKMVASFWMGVTPDTYVNMFKSDITVFGTNDKYFQKTNPDNILNNNNIKNDIDFIKHLIKNKNNKNNIFTSVKEMKGNYAINFFAAIAIPVANNISLIDGDYNGYILNLDNAKECDILYKGKRYVFTFIGLDYFGNDKIKEILNTVLINDDNQK